MTFANWDELLEAQADEEYWIELQSFVSSERKQHVVYPPSDEVYSAFDLTPMADVRVVILGQDPYHGERQAHGLAFSVRHGEPIPPSLRNIHTELRSDLGIDPPGHGNLEAWARQGVLLLNTSLTVRSGEAGSHSGVGWERFTDLVIDTLASGGRSLVFVLWGSHARKKAARIVDADPRHVVIESAHPSPLSARRGFFGSRPFRAVNAALGALGHDPIEWQIDAHGVLSTTT